MKRLFIIAMTTLAASSSFAGILDSNIIKCIGSNGVTVETQKYSDKKLYLSAQLFQPDLFVVAKAAVSGNVFYGITKDGRAISLTYQSENSILSVDGLADEVVSCKGRGFFEW